MTHAITIGPSAAKIVDADGRVSELPKARAATYRARCRCGWRSAEYATEGEAKVMGGAHVKLAGKPSGPAETGEGVRG